MAGTRTGDRPGMRITPQTHQEARCATIAKTESSTGAGGETLNLDMETPS